MSAQQPAADILSSLGIGKEEIFNRVVEQIVDRVVHSYPVDDEGNEYKRSSRFYDELTKYAKQKIDQKVEQLGDQHVLPRISAMIENLVLQETNKWGEKQGAPVTFIEYLVKRAESFLTEEVNSDGKTQKQADGYSWRVASTRVVFLVHQHLHYTIEKAMKEAVQNANDTIKDGLEKTVKLKLAEIAQSLKVNVQTK